jgi:hypothetical protein
MMMRWLTEHVSGRARGVFAMHRKVICTRTAPHDSDFIIGGEALPCLSAGECENALPPGRADAKQPVDGLSRLLLIVPAGPEKPICRRSFAAFKSLFSPADFPNAVSLSLFDMDLLLMQIARSRASRDFAAVARQSHAIAQIAGNLGALHVRDTAHLLEDACHIGDHAANYGLISTLSRACDEARTELNNWLAANSVMHRS